MENLPHHWPALLLVVFLLGLRHGMDPDHLATIDGVTRLNTAARPHAARWSGVLFSLGHGLVITCVAAAAGLSAKSWQAPGWLAHIGAGVSVFFLVALGSANLAAALSAAPDGVRLVGLKSRWLARWGRPVHPLWVAVIGGLFALSFDTLSQAALFSLSAGGGAAGWLFSVILGLTFMLGMMTSDGVNGWWIARLIHRADRCARLASRIMGFTVGGLSLGVAAWIVARYFLPALGGVPPLQAGAAVVLTAALGFAVALKLTARQAQRA